MVSNSLAQQSLGPVSGSGITDPLAGGKSKTTNGQIGLINNQQDKWMVQAPAVFS
jgi:hypothetical protein